MTKQQMFKKLKPYLSEEEIIFEKQGKGRKILGKVPPELFDEARYKLNMIFSHGSGNYSFTNPSGHFMSWYVRA